VEGEHVGGADDAGPGVELDLGELHAGDRHAVAAHEARGVGAVGVGARAGGDDGLAGDVFAELGEADGLAAEAGALAVPKDILGFARGELLAGELEELLLDGLGGGAHGGGDGRGGVAAAAADGGAEVAVADGDADVGDGALEDLGDDLGDDGGDAAADVLQAVLQFDAAVAADAEGGDDGLAAAEVAPDRRGDADAVADAGAAFALVGDALALLVPVELFAAELELVAADGVLVVGEAEVEGVLVEFAGELVEGELDGEGALRVAGGAEGGGGAGVGEDVVRLDADVGALRVDGEGVATDAGAGADAAAAVGEDLDRGEVTGGGGAEGDLLDGVGAVAGAQVLLAAVEQEGDGGAGLAGELAGDEAEARAGGGGAELGPEAAAEELGDDVDVLRLEGEDVGELVADGEDALGGAPGGQGFGGVPADDDAVGLEGAVGVVLRGVGGLVGDLGLAHALVDVALLLRGAHAQVAALAGRRWRRRCRARRPRWRAR
jgi:hypothetical protein